MNNKPVAWMQSRTTELSDGCECVQTVSFYKSNDDDIPLYTHPVKEQEEPNWKEMYWWMHELNHKHWSELSELKAHPVKELTDEEIEELIWNTTDMKDFAKAIIRKAQEK